jgi:hypothetical protein
MYVVPWQLLVRWSSIPPGCHGHCCSSKAVAISGRNPAHAFSPANAPSLLLLLLLLLPKCRQSGQQVRNTSHHCSQTYSAGEDK